MDLESRIRRLEDIEEIRSLRHRFHYAINESKPDLLRDVYTDDVVVYFDEFNRQEGVDNVVANARQLTESVFVRQYIHNHQIEINGDVGTGYCYLDARYAANGESLIVAARYDDEYRRTADGWRISHLRVKIIFSVPIQQGWADPAADAIGQEQFRLLASKFTSNSPAS